MADLPDIPLADLEEGLGIADETPTAPTAATPCNEQVTVSGFQDVSAVVIEQSEERTLSDDVKSSSLPLS